MIDDIPPVKSNFSHRMRNYFLTGVLVSAPILLTLYFTLFFLNLVDERVAGLLPESLYVHGGIPGFGLVVALVFFIALGWFATNFLGQVIIQLSESIVARMPVIRTIYGGFKQVFEMVMGKQAKAFREAVLVEFPKEGSWTIGFVTGTSQGEIKAHLGADMVNVYVPTTPNPTSGYLIFVPKNKIMALAMPVDEALKTVISCGMLAPPDRKIA